MPLHGMGFFRGFDVYPEPYSLRSFTPSSYSFFATIADWIETAWGEYPVSSGAVDTFLSSFHSAS
jgi:hypothetical protein